LARIIKERKRERDKVIEIVKNFSKELKDAFNKVTVFLVGSYARGDFNVWSDIDVLIVIEDCNVGVKERYSKVIPILLRSREYASIEPTILCLEEFRRGVVKKNPIVIEALSNGVVIIDELNLMNCEE